MFALVFVSLIIAVVVAVLLGGSIWVALGAFVLAFSVLGFIGLSRGWYE